MFAWQEEAPPRLANSEFVATPIELDLGVSRLDLTFDLWDSPEGFRGHIEYSTSLWKEATVARWWNHYLVLLDAMISTPTTGFRSLPLLSQADLNEITIQWNGMGFQGRRVLVHEAISSFAQLSPNSVALVETGRSVTYKELDERANFLAWRLRDIGVATNDVVAVALTRSIEAVIACLAILKSGAAFLLLDTHHPSHRLQAAVQKTSARATFGRAGELLWAGHSLDRPRGPVPLASAEPSGAGRLGIRDLYLGLSRQSKGGRHST